MLGNFWKGSNVITEGRAIIADEWGIDERGVTTAASIVPIWMPNQISSLATTGTAWEDDYYSLLPCLHSYMNGLSPGDPYGWTPMECLAPAGTIANGVPTTHEHPDGFQAVIGIGDFPMLQRMINDGFKIADWAFRSADQIGSTNLSNIHLKHDRVRTTIGNYEIYNSFTFNSYECHGFYGSGVLGFKILRMAPGSYTGTPLASWYDTTSIITGQNQSIGGGTLHKQDLWSEGVLGLGPGLGYSCFMSVPQTYPDGLYYTDPGLMKMWDWVKPATDGTFGKGNFSARPKPGYWSFWFVCPRTERISPVWFNRAGCPRGNITAIDANISDPAWFSDNWALNSFGDTRVIDIDYPNAGNPVWDQHSGDQDTLTGLNSPLFSGINAYSSNLRFSLCSMRPLREYVTQGYSYVQQPLEIHALTRGKATGNAHSSIIGCSNVGSQAEPAPQMVSGIALSHPVSKAPDADLVNDVTTSFTTFAFDSTIGRDSLLGQMCYATQTDDNYVDFFVTNGSLQCMRFGQNGFDGEAYTTALTRTNGVYNRSFDGTEIQRWVSSAEKALKITILGAASSGAYVVGTEIGLNFTDASITGSAAASVAQTLFFMPSSITVDPLIRVFGCTFAVAVGVSNEWRLPVYRTE